MEVPLGDTYEFLFTTRRFSTGAPYTLAGTPVLSVYEEANLTQITSGVSVSADYDSVTGLNQCSIVASSGNGYEVGKYYSVVITTGTVDSVSVVGEVVGHFRVMPAEDAGAGIKDVNATHAGDTAWGSGAITAGAIATGAIDADALAADAGTEIGTAVWATTTRVLTGNTNLNDPTAAAIADAVWDEAQADHVAAGSFGVTATEIADILTDTGTTLPATLAALNDISVADVLTTQMTESYNSDGSAPTLAQALHLIIAYLMERSVSGTTVTAKKLDGSTTAATFTLDDGTSPTSVTRAT